MKLPHGAPATIFATLVATLLVACAAENSADGPATTVTQSGDTTIVVPALDGPTGRLVSNLVIGADESNPDALFGQIEDAAFGPREEIYVVDSQADRVPRFRPDGSFAGLLARRGDGPGEVRSPEMIAVGVDGAAAVVAASAIELLDPDGQPRASFDRTSLVSPARFDPDGRLLIHRGPVVPPRTAIWRVSGGGSPAAAIRSIQALRPEYAIPFEMETLAPDGSSAEPVPGPYEFDDYPCPRLPDAPGSRICFFVAYQPHPGLDWLPDGRRMEWRTESYRIDIGAADGGPAVRSLRPPRPPVPLSDEVAAIIGSNFTQGDRWPSIDSVFTPPTHVPAIARVLPARDGRIWVRLHAPSATILDDDGEEVHIETESRFDVFTPEGEHVGYVTGPADLTLRDVRGDTVLTTRTGALGVGIVERFVIDWTGGGA